MNARIRDDRDRIASGRFVRNLALSLSGGALLTLLGASAAHAQDAGQAGTDSAGTGAAHSGDATAVGNTSGTNTSETTNISGGVGNLQVIGQSASVSNTGVAVANTGGNRAVGNSSNNGATLNETAGIGGGAVNSGKAGNGSNGYASISTGDASATGNDSSTNLVLDASSSAHGQLGAILIVQSESVTNSGVALANTGGNRARGNDSDNTSTLTQIAQTSNGLAANNGKATNDSDGKATIATGNAAATGNKSDTSITQSTAGSAGGDDPGGLTVIAQAADVTNRGLAVANTGGNRALGNGSTNEILRATQDANVGTPNLGVVLLDGIGLASNAGDAGNVSDGDASIDTGDAWAAGNRSHTEIGQASIAEGGGLHVYPQGATVTNAGVGVANTGLNRARGNTSNSRVTTDQNADIGSGNNGIMTSDAVGLLASNQADLGNASDGSAAVHTGDAAAVGNDSTTTVSQDIDPVGLVLPVQAAAVVNAGAGIANTGANSARGNDSDNVADSGPQIASIGSNNNGLAPLSAPLIIASNATETTNTSDGSASIATGNASAMGNHSATSISQASNGTVDGLGLVLNTQVAVVANAGLGVANTGLNAAVGNTSDNDSSVDPTFGQSEEIASRNNGVVAITSPGPMTAANQSKVTNTSDGSASITTGDATAVGNASTTWIAQREDAAVGGIGAVINTQAAGVANVGVGIANTGLNAAVGNASASEANANQFADIGVLDNGSVEVTAAGPITLSNSLALENASDGSASVATGAADATGNASSTELVQSTRGDVDGIGLVVNTQVGAVVNAGVGVANSGANLAVGNAADAVPPAGPDAGLAQDSEVADFDNGLVSIDALGPLTVANQGRAGSTSDGAAEIRTGAAQAHGNRSTTALSQDQAGTVDHLGAVVNTQAGGVANVGVGVANSGLNAAFGNTSNNQSGLSQSAILGNGVAGVLDIDGLGPITVGASGEASNTSDGTAKVGTGDARASGNVSDTTLIQHQTSEVEDLGLIVGTQAGGVANVGVGIANTGLNLAVGNDSDNVANASQRSLFAFVVPQGDVIDLTVVGPTVVGASGQATNSSDGEACVCTGDATASGNESTTTLSQDLSTTVGTGVAVMTEAGGVLNAGLGVANSGLNAAIGNTSDNTATSNQTATAQDAFGPGPDVVGPQVLHNGGGANNASDGAGKVGTGKATAVGNRSTTAFVQAAAVDSDFAVATLAGGTTNTGLGLANSGLNLGIGNASTNHATLTQTADGDGIVANDGTASNESDGTAAIGDPSCDVPGGVPTTTPGLPGLPKTGGWLEIEATVGLMLLLAGFGLRRTATARS